jgi:hypothetical protein
MPDDWSHEEVAAAVGEYFAMLSRELRGEPYNKRESNRRLQQLLPTRTAGAIEFKHANISAVLIELGFPYIDGYKPRGNYQELLKEEVVTRLDRDQEISIVAQTAIDAPVREAYSATPLSDIFVTPPVRERNRARAFERLPTVLPRRNVDYLEREAHNRALGRAGEEFTLAVERRRLMEAGEPRLAANVDHVSRTQGDGLGYDILSFEADGRERLIEVKTTSFGVMTPFYASRREVTVSMENASAYRLYRVFKFREFPRVFVLAGALGQSCILEPVQYQASLL